MIVNVVLLPTRYLLIIGIAVLGLIFFKDINITSANGLDFERILPAALNTFIPSGLLGLILVGLMGAFMGTFAGTFNAAQAYMVNDIYLKSINPEASNKQITRMSYLSGLVVVFISIMLGFFAKDVNSILQWIVSALYGGYISANVLKWHWWRFNSYGFFWGMFAGIASAMIMPTIFPDALPLYYFPIILLLSAIGSVVGSLMTPATDTEVLKKFYKNVRPWGFWKPIQVLVEQEDAEFEANHEFKSDMFNVVVGTIAQTAITALPVYVVLMMPMHIAVSATILSICAFILWKTWYKKLPND
jgi:Na+/proline symporter